MPCSVWVWRGQWRMVIMVTKKNWSDLREINCSFAYVSGLKLSTYSRNIPCSRSNSTLSSYSLVDSKKNSWQSWTLNTVKHIQWCVYLRLAFFPVCPCVLKAVRVGTACTTTTHLVCLTFNLSPNSNQHESQSFVPSIYRGAVPLHHVKWTGRSFLKLPGEYPS